MRTFFGESCTINYNSDYSGEITIIARNNNEDITVNAEDIISFVGNMVKVQMISKLEDTDSVDLLNYLAKGEK